MSLHAVILSAGGRGRLGGRAVARMGREFGHKRRLGHAGLSVHLEAEQSLRPLDAVVVAEIRPAHAPAAESLVRPQRCVQRSFGDRIRQVCRKNVTRSSRLVFGREVVILP